MNYESEFINRIIGAVEPILSGLVVAVIFILFTMVIRIRFRGQEPAARIKRPQTLLFVYVIFFAITTACNLYWPELFKIAHLFSLLILSLALILIFSVGLFDLFLDRYRALKLPSIFRDMVVLVLYVVVVVMVLSEEGVEVTSLVATSAVLTAIIGFALQDLLGNVAAGLSIQIENPYRVGDWVAFEKSEGEVLEINWRATKIKTLNNDIVVIPNNVATKSPLTNFSVPSKKQRREFSVGLRYEAPPSRVHHALLEAVKPVEGVLSDPPAMVQTKSYDDFSIKYRLRYYIDDFARREDIDSQVATRVWYRLKREGLTVPFPIRDVNMKAVDPDEDKHKEDHRRRETEKMIGQVPVFEPLSEEDVALLAEHSASQLYTVGETIINQGDEGSSFFIIAEGEVEVGISWQKQRFKKVAALGPGDYFGERSLMTGEARSATVRTLCDCDVVVVEKDTFARILRRNPALVESIGKILVAREGKTSEATMSSPIKDSGSRRTREEALSLAGKIRRFFAL